MNDMNVFSRAHRILTGIRSYTAQEKGGEIPGEFSEVHLGESLGYYEDRNSGFGKIVFFSEGMVWKFRSELINLRYSDVVRVSIPDGKESQGIIIEIRSGDKVTLPITGRNGKFFDSMEVLRFLDRVIDDLN